MRVFQTIYFNFLIISKKNYFFSIKIIIIVLHAFGRFTKHSDRLYVLSFVYVFVISQTLGHKTLVGELGLSDNRPRTVNLSLPEGFFGRETAKVGRVREDSVAGEGCRRSESRRRRRGAMRKSARAGGGKNRGLSDRLVTLQRRLHQALMLGFRFAFFFSISHYSLH